MAQVTSWSSSATEFVSAIRTSRATAVVSRPYIGYSEGWGLVVRYSLLFSLLIGVSSGLSVAPLAHANDAGTPASETAEAPTGAADTEEETEAEAEEQDGVEALPPSPEPPPEEPEPPVEHVEHAGRYDFVRNGPSEPTEVQTEGDVTVLSNKPADERPLVPPTEPGSARPVKPSTPAGSDIEVAVNEASDVVPREVANLGTSAARQGPSARDDSTGTNWWLWLLGGCDLALLVPIGLLLTRATR